MAQHQLDSLDKKILKMIAEDARVPFLEVARECNVSGAAIHQRIQKLTNLGVIKGSQFIIDPEKIGYETCAYVGLYLKDPGTFDTVVEELKKIPEVVECHYTTGGYDMFIKIYARNNPSPIGEGLLFWDLPFVTLLLVTHKIEIVLQAKKAVRKEGL